MADRRNKKRRRRRRGLFHRLFSLSLVCAALFFGTSIFFKVTVIEVEGGAYPPEEIIAASGVQVGDNLLFISGGSARENILKALPYVEQVKLKKSFPNRVVLAITDSFPIAYTEFDGSYLILDKRCKVLEIASEVEQGGLMAISGLSPETATAGERLSVGEEQGEKLAYLETMFLQFIERNMKADVRTVDIEDVDNLKFEYLDDLTVEMGKNEMLDKKFTNLFAAIDNAKPVNARIIPLTGDEVARIINKK